MFIPSEIYSGYGFVYVYAYTYVYLINGFTIHLAGEL